MKRKTISAKGSSVARIEPSRLGCGFSELDFSMVPSEIACLDLGEDALLLAQDVVGLHLAAAVALDALVERGLDQLVAVDEGDLLDLARGDVLLHLGGR